MPAGVRMGDDVIELYEPDGKTRKKDFEVDSRPVTIPSTKGIPIRPIAVDPSTMQLQRMNQTLSGM